jgi:hypothetical protein
MQTEQAQRPKFAEQEFAFRYLFPADARLQRWPLDAFEQQLHFAPPVPPYEAGDAEDLEPIYRGISAGVPPPAGLRARLLYALLAIHVPTNITPFGIYGRHGSYPSPRAYYPLMFTLIDRERAHVCWIDPVALRLVPLASAISRGTAPLALKLGVNFEIYDALYNLFRKSLFALEAGHFFAELTELGNALGFTATLVFDDDDVRAEITDQSEAPVSATALQAHQDYARSRNSSHFGYGLYPVRYPLAGTELAALYQALRVALAAARQQFPLAVQYPISIRICLHAAAEQAAGIYALESNGLRCVSDLDPFEACETLYNYPNFNVSNATALVFLGVERSVFALSDTQFIALNCALGFIAQYLIRYATGLALFARPFRSYDQHGMDRLLQFNAESRMTYYGVMLGRNRCAQHIGVLR